jgi:secondary thiamine-phosphate synthase enzyme
MMYTEELNISTNGHGAMTDISGSVEEIVKKSKIQKGLVNVFVVGSTAAITTIEYEPGLRADFPQILDKLIPPSRNYGHEQAWHDGNGHSHLQASVVGPEITIPVKDGSLLTGTWQQIVLIELDVRGRKRQVAVTVTGQQG